MKLPASHVGSHITNSHGHTERKKKKKNPSLCLTDRLAVSWGSAEKNVIGIQLEMLFSKDCQTAFFFFLLKIPGNSLLYYLTHADLGSGLSCSK